VYRSVCSTCAADEPVSDDTCCCAAVTLADAAVTATCSEGLSIVASTVPLAILAPTAALTLFAEPGTGNDRSARCAGSMVPAALTVCWTVPVDARTRVYAGVVGDPDRIGAQAPVPPCCAVGFRISEEMTGRTRTLVGRPSLTSGAAPSTFH